MLLESSTFSTVAASAPHSDFLVRLREKEATLASHAEPPNTVKAYKHAWRDFETWCREWRRCDPLPATPAIVREYIVWATRMREPAYELTTVRLHTYAIRRAHKRAGVPPPMDDSVGDVLRSLALQAARNGARKEVPGKRHLTVEQLRHICSALESSPIDARDRAMFLVGFASALRRSDLSRLTVANTHLENGRIRLWVPYSKTDQRGDGRDVFLHPGADSALCPLKALETWKQTRLTYFGNFRGPLFVRFRWREMTDLPMTGQAICDALKKHLERAGVDPNDYGAHSMRSGMITAADEAGASIRAIMDQSGHRNLENVMRYIKSNRKANPLKGVL